MKECISHTDVKVILIFSAYKISHNRPTTMKTVRLSLTLGEEKL